MTPDELDEVLAEVHHALAAALDRDWSTRAGELDWSCRATVDHTVDCVFSFAMQVAARAESGFLPFGELHANDAASNDDLLQGLVAVGRMFLAVVGDAPAGTLASDGVLALDVGDWCARAGYELALHTYDVLSGLDIEWVLQPGLCLSITESPGLWMFDRSAAAPHADPWIALLSGSGRTARR